MPLPPDVVELVAGDPPEHARRNGWLRRVGLILLSFFAAWVIIGLIGRIDWGAVRDGLSHLAWWQLLLLVGVLMVRQTLNALPLVFFIDGLSLYRAVVNDLAAHLLALIAPPPGDIVMRVGMFTSWGIDGSRAIAGSLMNMLAFYITRFSVPILGFLIILPVRFDGRYALVALVGAAVAGSLAALIVLGLRSEQFAERVGLTAGRVAAKVRRSIDPSAWAEAMIQFRLDMKSTFAAGFPRSALGLGGLVVADASVLLLALRFVGVSSSELPAVELYAAFLCVYPLTFFPFMGLGVVDALLLAVVVDVAGLDVEGHAIAALIVWRVFTLAGPVLLGAASLGLWKHGQRASAQHPD